MIRYVCDGCHEVFQPTPNTGLVANIPARGKTSAIGVVELKVRITDQDAHICPLCVLDAVAKLDPRTPPEVAM